MVPEQLDGIGQPVRVRFQVGDVHENLGEAVILHGLVSDHKLHLLSISVPWSQ